MKLYSVVAAVLLLQSSLILREGLAQNPPTTADFRERERWVEMVEPLSRDEFTRLPSVRILDVESFRSAAANYVFRTEAGEASIEKVKELVLKRFLDAGWTEKPPEERVTELPAALARFHSQLTFYNINLDKVKTGNFLLNRAYVRVFRNQHQIWVEAVFVFEK